MWSTVLTAALVAYLALGAVAGTGLLLVMAVQGLQGLQAVLRRSAAQARPEVAAVDLPPAAVERRDEGQSRRAS